jgi:hypothetical protein
MAIINTAHIRHSLNKSWMQHRWLHRSWWVIVFVALCSVLYLHAMRQKEASYKEMMSRLEILQQEKVLAQAQQEELLLQIQSQSDPAWVELVLKRNLGMVPEGQTKVYFH